MLFALPNYQFPYIVMNRCLYLRGYNVPMNGKSSIVDMWAVASKAGGCAQNGEKWICSPAHYGALTGHLLGCL